MSEDEGEDGRLARRLLGLGFLSLGDLGAAPPRRFGRYELLDRLGEGAFGEVFRARDVDLDRQVALKLLHPALAIDVEALERFRREARALSALEHVGIPRVYDAGVQGGRAFVVMELVEGTPLEEHLARAPLKERVRLVEEVARIVEAAHRTRIVHRDLKPANVLVGRDGRPRLLDFGIAKAMARADPSLTGSGVLLGTPAYMSPEQALGESHAADERSDVFSLGALLFHALSGGPPFARPSIPETVSAILEAPPPALRDGVPAPLAAIAGRALEKEPARRYQSAAALADDLRAWRVGRRQWRRRGVAAPAAAALLLLGLGLGGGLLLGRRTPAPAVSTPAAPTPAAPTPAAPTSRPLEALDRAVERGLAEGRATQVEGCLDELLGRLEAAR